MPKPFSEMTLLEQRVNRIRLQNGAVADWTEADGVTGLSAAEFRAAKAALADRTAPADRADPTLTETEMAANLGRIEAGGMMDRSAVDLPHDQYARMKSAVLDHARSAMLKRADERRADDLLNQRRARYGMEPK
ncbi:MAG TPA: hypothetical protein VF286_00955 [Acidiphilium sp.]